MVARILTILEVNMCPNTIEQLSVACNFLSLTNLTVCQTREFFDGVVVGNTIPSEIGLLTQLTYLGLGENQLNGTIPSTLGNLVQLNSLLLGNNQLSGTIPSTLGNLVQLTDLGLVDNQLNGTIPSTLGNLVKLSDLTTWNNQLIGTIPSTLGNLVQLTYQSIERNHSIALRNLVKLNSLLLDMNQLTGTIPSTLGNLTQHSYLDVYNNTRLSGTISSALCSIFAIQIAVDCANIECACCLDGSNYSDVTFEYGICPVT